jgi:hypothetical protein
MFGQAAWSTHTVGSQAGAVAVVVAVGREADADASSFSRLLSSIRDI